MSGLLRSIKNVTNGYTPAQVKVRNATSNEEFGPSTQELHEIAELTRSNQELFFIMDMIDKRLNDKGKNWRHVLKSLTLLDYLVRYGSDNVIIWCKENFYVVKSLREFQYRDESGEDHGIPIRQRAKELTSLLNNSERLRAERQQARSGRRRPTDRYRSDSDDRPRDRDRERERERSRERPNRYRDERQRSDSGVSRSRRTPDAEADDLQRAIELSKQTVEEDEKRRAQLRSGTADLNKAVQVSVQQQQTGLYSQEDWAKYQAAQQEYLQYQQQLAALQQQQQQQQQATGFAQGTGYEYQQSAFQPQNTGYQQDTGFQPQNTGFQPQNTGYQPQSTGYQQDYQNQHTGYQQQQQQQQPAPLQPVKTGSNNPFAQPTGQATGQATGGYAGGYSASGGYATYPQTHQQTHQQPLAAQHTNNPFQQQQQQQYTGIATTQMQPSHTGYGFGNARGGDSLIDL